MCPRPAAKVNRLRTLWDPIVKQAITAAAKLEVMAGVTGAVELPDPVMEWRDGLPEDEQERAQIDTMYVTAGLMSKETALRRRGFDGDPNDPDSPLGAELARIKDEAPTAPAPGATPKITLQTQNFGR